MELNTRILQKVGEFFDTHDAAVTDRAVLYVIDDVHYRIDETGCWYFAGEPETLGWTLCEPPPPLRDLS